MRQILSTAITAVVVSLLTLTVAGAVAQSEPDPAQLVQPAAGVNADRVDGKHAIGYTNKKAVRRGKLVATNAAGELPSNIVKPYWGYIKNKPGILADDQVSWGEIAGIPAGFADGVDDQGITGVRIVRKLSDSPTVITPGNFGYDEVSCPPSAVLTGGGFAMTGQASLNVLSSQAVNATTWNASAFLPGSAPGNAAIHAFAMCMSVDPSGGVTTASRGVEPSTLRVHR